MRIWHENLIPKLCRQHLLACWREGLGAYKIITEDKKGYRNHPAVKEFETRTAELWLRLNIIRKEMLARGYNPKDLPEFDYSLLQKYCQEWQTLDEQIIILRNKHCNCMV